MARHSKKRNNGRKTAWGKLILYSLAAFILGYVYAVGNFSF